MVLDGRYVIPGKMKIIFNTGVFGKHGIERALTTLLRELPREKHEYILHQIFQLDYVSPLMSEVAEHVTHDCSLPLNTFWGNLHMNRKRNIALKLIDSIGLQQMHRIVGRNLNRHRADVIVDYDLSLLRAAHLIEAPLIGFFHFRPKRFRNGGTNKLRRIGKRLSHYKKLVVLCQEMREEAEFVWPHLKDKFLVLPNPINLEELARRASEQDVVEPYLRDEKFFLTMARLTHQKNIHLLLRSYKKAREAGCEWPLVIVGDGEDRDELLSLRKKLNLDNSVLMSGYKTNPIPYLKFASGFIMSSREEGFPVSILEAMALKCPVISLACPTGPRDLLEDQKRGILVPFTEGDPTRLSEAMLTLMKNDLERAAYASESYEYVKQFSAATISTQLFTSLKNLACTH